ncbi:E3 ubiquitin-protein ligase Praja-2 isoform X1 [Vombatus ursinus]|uniref:RING-type E3 ubiquitin transferase n=1 Tax=Vombatus ursinus TaxID=29139 RepID=A0A4X2KF22_VOMUR|nr:E3 ubiquitin-protein ligase Praja-2 isoform X1 [Vombatus ursinus]XP_027725044.1 E3 ubiquitin-protein ligase Praja-2 isoform X1 [Vombatus ursinus]XP_027725045.1 E3 ubiquitin-protein ligase Praja-2 isoform X1 [Vombatus ursinus]
MGQESGKPTWPKPAGGYQTITGRRYGRRHAYVSFKPSLTNQERSSSQQSGECEGLELDDVQKKKASCCSPLVQVRPSLSGIPLLENTGAEIPICRAALTQATERSPSPFSAIRHNLEGSETSGSSLNLDYSSDYSSRYTPRKYNVSYVKSGIAFVNIDSYEPDSSDGEDNSRIGISAVKMETGKFQETLDDMLYDLEKGVDSLSGLQSKFSTFNLREGFEERAPASLVKYSNNDTEFVHHNNRTLERSSAEDEAVAKKYLNYSSCERQRKNIIEVPIRTPVDVHNELNTSDGKKNQANSSELVVRPKVRKQAGSSQLDRKNLFSSDEDEKSNIERWRENSEPEEIRSEGLLRSFKDKKNSSMFFDPRDYEGTQKKMKYNQIKPETVTVQERQAIVDDNTFWNSFEDYCRYYYKGEDSSECSDGEWSASLPHFSAREKDQSSSDESWETLPGKDEHEPELQSNSSGPEEDNPEYSFQTGDQTSLEEGEIPWLQYHEEIESSSDEENDPVSHFVHPGFFMLDGNNNLEDDSSVSEDLDVEWRLLDEFGDGLGVAQAISYVDPQFLTYMALEERLAQAMETALAHLESLAVDVDQAHPPASKESIDCLPQTIVTEDHTAVGQEQCCAICCSEYIKDEIITELPCNHFFHKPCVTLWLQKSGTCPVCRHVLAPILPEATAVTSFLSDHDSLPSVHTATGTQ